MKLNLALILSIILAVGVVAYGFTVYQISTERATLNTDLENNNQRLAEGLMPLLDRQASSGYQQFDRLWDSISQRTNLLGISIVLDVDSVIASHPTVKAWTKNYALDYAQQALTAGSPQSKVFKEEVGSVFQSIYPDTRGSRPFCLVLYSDASYIDHIMQQIWLRNFLRWFAQALIISCVTVLIIRWGIFSPINKIVDWVKAARSGNLYHLRESPPAKFLAPLHREIINIAKAMHEAKAIAEEEARLRSTGMDAWTPERLKVEMEILLQKKKMIVVSNREPYMHVHEGKNIKVIVPASGLITAMEPILKACGGLWIASGTGDADKETVDAEDKVQVPPENPSYVLKRLWLTKEEEDHFYYGFSNEGMWPLCHIAHTRPVFREQDWRYYQKVNQDFANAVLAEIKGEETPLILIQDYHFALLPQMIKKKRPDARVGIFWHIPWPNPESFGICPWQKDILRGMLGADLIGFHTQYHCNHFLETVNNSLEARVVWENFSVRMAGHSTLVKPFPISIAFSTKDLESETVKVPISQLLAEHGITATRLGVGVDRIDYTKGLVEKLLSIERFFEKYPQYIGEFTFVQIGAPSRTLLKTYSDMVSAVENEANRINWKLKTKNWKPIILLKRHHSHEEILPYYAAADLCIVSSLHDGMNLVAKEYIATRSQNDGTLILSRFAGASQDLNGAIIINPYDVEDSAEAIKYALEMPMPEQQRRMHQLRQQLAGHNIFAWAASLIRTMVSI